MSKEKVSFIEKILNEWKTHFSKWIVLLLMGLLTFLFTPVWNNLIEIYETPGKISKIEKQLDSISSSIRSLTGEDKVLSVNRLQTFALEPVVIGETLSFYLVAARTAFGEECILESKTPIFVDTNGLTHAGKILSDFPQFSSTQERILLSIEIPKEVSPGRTVLTISLMYSCSGRSIIETVNGFSFQLLPSEE